mmetsp:Transcript_42736/g.134865  ORF Transcript_42736/g.134865 Transcript_42736/m.134865 type:complete len:283 (-) Transcript_42736:97-945(-)
MGGTAPDTAHFWVMSLLLLLLGLNDPLYAACLARGGDLTLQAASAWAEACFSTLLLLFWLARADSMSSSRGDERVAPLGCSSFWAPKLLAVGAVSSLPERARAYPRRARAPPESPRVQAPSSSSPHRRPSAAPSPSRSSRTTAARASRRTNRTRPPSASRALLRALPFGSLASSHAPSSGSAGSRSTTRTRSARRRLWPSPPSSASSGSAALSTERSTAGAASGLSCSSPISSSSTRTSGCWRTRSGPAARQRRSRRGALNTRGIAEASSMWRPTKAVETDK